MKTIREIIRRRKESEPWNKSKIIGQKPPLLPKHVWAIGTKLQMGKRLRDLALFNLAIDSKLRGCDVVQLRLEDVAPNGYTIERAIIRQQKTGHPVKFELTEQPRGSVDEFLSASDRLLCPPSGHSAPPLLLDKVNDPICLLLSNVPSNCIRCEFSAIWP